MRLGPYVNWTDEKACFKSFLAELASFYVPEHLPPAPSPQVKKGSDVADVEMDEGGHEQPQEERAELGTEDPEIAARRTYLHRTIENVLFPAFRARLVATKGLLKGVVEVADLKGLYRVFERC
jgi:DNA mismatch repair protein MLH1